jgi:hypothetical protein
MPGDETSVADDEVREFVVEGYRGAARRTSALGDPLGVVNRLVDPANAKETLHWGRNYLYVVEIEAPTEIFEVVVKQFRNQGTWARQRRKMGGSKALKSWRGALALMEAGVATPEPLMLVESVAPEGPSFYVSRRLPDFFEARYFFRALNDGRESELFPQVDVQGFLAAVGKTLRRLHDGGVWHRDVSVGNLLVRYEGPEPVEPTIYLVDLNRVRVGLRMTTGRRTRDLCRLRIFDAAHQEVFLRAYWGEDDRGFGRKRLLYRICLRGFLTKIWLKKAIRAPFRSLTAAVKPRHGHVHLPPAPVDTAKRDKVVWDRLSDQPHQHAGRLERLSVRLGDFKSHGGFSWLVARQLPRIRGRYLELKEELYRLPLSWGGVGLALRPREEDPEGLIAAVEELGVRNILLRLHPWQQDHGAEEVLAGELARRGCDLTFALPQNRELVCDPARWQAAVSELAARFLPYGRRFQVGQAINRSKWGVWNLREYLPLVATASEILRRQGNVEILGPAVIDYEFHATVGILNLQCEGIQFDIVSSLLYVDRRGAPENRQLGFDTVDKVVQLKAIAETARNSSGRSWITEVNWPLKEGPHSPAGRKVSVDEERQADYLTRYYLLALGTGQVERVYWWRLVARGYGLIEPIDNGHLRRRPSFRAMATLTRHLEGTTFLGPLPSADPVRLYLFRQPDGSEVVVGWSTDGRTRATLPRAVCRLVSRDGDELDSSRVVEVEVEGSPRYFWLEPS